MTSGAFPSRICWLDIESTGTNLQTDRIIDLAMVRTDLDLKLQAKCTLRFHPGMEIPWPATVVHGIKDEDVFFAPTFGENTAEYDKRINEALLEAGEQIDPRLLAADTLCTWITQRGLHRFGTFAGIVWAFMKDSVFGGYNLAAFDLPLLAAEFDRAGWDKFPGPEQCHVIDAGVIFKKKEPRTLSDAVRLYCNREHEGAHGAEVDVQATIDVFRAQRRHYVDLTDKPLPELSAFSRFDGPARIDWEGKLVRDAEGFAVYAIGKSKGRRVMDDPGFGQWMLERDFSPDTKRAVELALRQKEAL